MFVVLVVVVFKVRFNVAMESHPFDPVNVTEYVPAEGYALAFHVYGNWLGQTAMFVVLVEVEFKVRFSVAMESHPFEPVKVTE